MRGILFFIVVLGAFDTGDCEYSSFVFSLTIIIESLDDQSLVGTMATHFAIY